MEVDRQLPSPWPLLAHNEKSSDVDGRNERKCTVHSFPTASAHLPLLWGKKITYDYL